MDLRIFRTELFFSSIWVFSVGAFCETKNARLLQRPFFPPDHGPSSERSTFYTICLGFPTLLKSNLGCFQRVPLSATIVFKDFVVTRQLKGFGFTVFFGIVRLFPEIFLMSTKMISSPLSRFSVLLDCFKILIFRLKLDFRYSLSY